MQTQSERQSDAAPPVTPGYVPDHESDLRVCVAHDKPLDRLETFIRAHVERLPCPVIDLELVKRTDLRFEDRSLLVDSPGWVSSLRRRLWGRGHADRYDRVLAGFFKSQRVDAVLGEYGTHSIKVVNACVQAKVPLIVHFHGVDAYHHETLEKLHDEYAAMFQHAAALVAVSQAMQRQLIALGAPAEKVHCNHYGVDVELFHGADPADAPAVFVGVGRFTDKKAPHLTILAFAKVLEQVDEAKLIMIGDGELFDACSQLVQALGLAGSVSLLGRRSPQQIAQVLRGARGFVQHSLRPLSGDSEGTPLAILEAGAMGLPVVATRHAGIMDTVVEEETGLLVDEHDIDAMAAQMLRLARDAQLAARLGRAARQRIGEHFNVQRSLARLMHIIDAAVQRHRAGK